MVTSGPLLPSSRHGWHYHIYVCTECREPNAGTAQEVGFGPWDAVPGALRLPCWGAGLDAGTGVDAVPLHRYLLAGPASAPPSDPPGGSQGPTQEGAAHP